MARIFLLSTYESNISKSISQHLQKIHFCFFWSLLSDCIALNRKLIQSNWLFTLQVRRFDFVVFQKIHADEIPPNSKWLFPMK